MDTKVYLGIDIGTSVVKGTAISDSGEIISQHHLLSKHGSKVAASQEFDPDLVWWSDFLDVTHKILDEIGTLKENIACIAVTGMIPNITLLDKQGIPLHNAILFYDDRAYDIEKRLDEELRSTKWQNEVLSKLIWIRENLADVWARTHQVLTTHSYLVHKLTGNYSVDTVTALESGNVYDGEVKGWNSEFLNRYGIHERVFPSICAPTTVMGHLRDTVANTLGIRKSIPVIAGTSDTVSSVLGAGLRRKGEMLIYYGTYNCAALLNYDVSDILSGNLSSNPIDWTATIPRSGKQLDVLAREFFPTGSRQESLATLDQKASSSIPGANGVLFIQTIDFPVSTVSTDPRGSLFNLRVTSTMYDIARALLEAFGYGLRYSFEVLGSDPNPSLCFAAGGGARSSIWKQIVSDITGFEQIHLPAADRGVGSAILAGTAIEPDFLDRITASMLENATIVRPNKDNYDVYNERYEMYRSLLSKYNDGQQHVEQYL